MGRGIWLEVEQLVREVRPFMQQPGAELMAPGLQALIQAV